MTSHWWSGVPGFLAATFRLKSPYDINKQTAGSAGGSVL